MKVPSTEVQNNFGKYVKFAEANEEIIVTRKGKAVAKIVPCLPSHVAEEAAEYKTSDGWVTYEEFRELTEKSEQRFELIDGVIYFLTSPSYKHQHAIHELHGAFYNWFRGKSCTPLTSPFDVTFFKAENNICVVQPDIAVICDRENVNEQGRYIGTPALVVEVLSPSTRSKDMLKKLELYKQCGVKEYWIVDPVQDQVLIYSFDELDIKDSRAFSKSALDTAKSYCFPGLQVDLQEIFISLS